MSDVRQPSRRLVFGATIGAVLLMGICYPAIKLGLPHASPLLFGGMRSVLGGSALLLAAVVIKGSAWPPARLAGWILPLGLVATALTYGLMFSSPAFTSSGLSSVLGNTQPLFLTLLGVIVLGEPLTKYRLLGLSIGFAGVILLATTQSFHPSDRTQEGILLAVGTAAASSVASIWVKALKPGKHLIALTGWQLVVGGIFLLVLSRLLGESGAVHFDANFIVLLALLSLGSTAAATFLWFWALQHGDASELGRFLFLAPVFGVALAVAWIGESLDLWEMAGMLLIVLSLLFAKASGRTSDSGNREIERKGAV
ncbi:MAG: DMT family transporter [Verrucomicrobiae bacterium]|nr:DMT family transporter [Verrucomicrobiae bacterium]